MRKIILALLMTVASSHAMAWKMTGVIESGHGQIQLFDSQATQTMDCKGGLLAIFAGNQVDLGSCYWLKNGMVYVRRSDFTSTKPLEVYFESDVIRVGK